MFFTEAAEALAAWSEIRGARTPRRRTGCFATLSPALRYPRMRNLVARPQDMRDRARAAQRTEDDRRARRDEGLGSSSEATGVEPVPKRTAPKVPVVVVVRAAAVVRLGVSASSCSNSASSSSTSSGNLGVRGTVPVPAVASAGVSTALDEEPAGAVINEKWFRIMASEMRMVNAGPGRPDGSSLPEGYAPPSLPPITGKKGATKGAARTDLVLPPLESLRGFYAGRIRTSTRAGYQSNFKKWVVFTELLRQEKMEKAGVDPGLDTYLQSPDLGDWGTQEGT